MKVHDGSAARGAAYVQRDDLDRDQKFSWVRCFISIVSYGLLSSDVVRSGVGIQTLSEYFAVQPDVFIALGPYAYPIVHLTTTNASSDSFEAFWPYKYDTTSLAMRSVAEHLKLSKWPSCVLYKHRCDETRGLEHASIFHMIDSMVAGVAEHVDRRNQRNPNSSRQVTLRIEHLFRDRLHHYALPWIFGETLKRTTQAVHFEYDSNSTLSTVCGRARPQPYSCGELWVKYVNGFCGRPTLPPCDGTLWTDLIRRLDDLSQAYPNHTIDFVVLDSLDDGTGGALTFQGHKDLDIVTLTRIRRCANVRLTASASSNQACTTVAVDDYRYESGYFTMDAPSWFPLVATLRVFGQSYMWLRLALLFVGCFFASTSTTSPSRFSCSKTQLFRTFRTLFLIPNQVVIYGSPSPIVAYAVAHLIDSPAVYELVENHFDSWLGNLSINLSDFVSLCSVSMRAVWTLGLACHVLLLLLTDRASSNLHGVPGIPEFSISLIACASIVAQYRAVAFRSTEILDIHEVIPSQRHRQGIGKTLRMTRSTLSHLLAGNPFDAKSVTSVLLILFVLVALVWVLNRLFPRRVPFVFALVSRTVVPYTAGALWLRNRMMVSWVGHVVVESKRTLGAAAAVAPKKGPTFDRSSRFASFYPALARPSVHQRDLHSIHSRSSEVDAMVFLINLAAMTDPITFANLRLLGGQRIAVFATKSTGRRVLLPYAMVGSDADVPIDWSELELLEVVNSKQLAWHQLLTCG